MHLRFHNPRVRFAAVFVVGLLLLCVVLLVLLSWGKQLDERHSPTEFSESFDYATGSFASYLAWSERRVRQAHPAASDYVISGLLPFRLEAPPRCADSAALRNGIVLTHDLRDSAYTMRELGSYFQERCFLVFALLLPEHGTRPGDLLNSDWESWVAAERFAARTLAREVDNLYLGGHGVGGTLAILEAANNAEVDGLVLFAPALDRRGPSWRTFADAALGWLLPHARWAEVVPAYSAYRYESWPQRLRAQSNALIAALEAALPTRPFEVPVFMVASQEDTTVSTAAILDYMAERVHPLSHTLLYSRDPLPETPERLVVYPSHYPDLGLASVSHLGLMLPMYDSEFGWYGSSHDCGHYYAVDTAAYTRCMAGERTLLGEVTPAQLAEGLLERSAFNPFYTDMLRSLDTFIGPVAPVPDIRQR